MLDVAEMWDFDDPKKSEARFRTALRGADRRDQQLLMTQLARAVGLQGRYDDGLALLAVTQTPDPEIAAWVHLERGRILRSSGSPDKARSEFEAAVRDAVGSDALHIDALHMLALVAEPEEQSALHEEALRMAQTSRDLRARDWDATLLNNIAMAHADAGEWRDALASFELALSSRERQGDAARIRVARWMVAWAMRHLGHTVEALSIQRMLKAELVAIGEADPHVDEEITLLEQAFRK
ncbi:MAG: tetratricopeptide repeat protein [Nocardioides sp.]|nr:tetratricopeptide repeat protein [Nocardioides sp.]